jgi:hypothetical protein
VFRTDWTRIIERSEPVPNLIEKHEAAQTSVHSMSKSVSEARILFGKLAYKPEEWDVEDFEKARREVFDAIDADFKHAQIARWSAD